MNWEPIPIVYICIYIVRLGEHNRVGRRQGRCGPESQSGDGMGEREEPGIARCAGCAGDGSSAHDSVRSTHHSALGLATKRCRASVEKKDFGGM